MKTILFLFSVLGLFLILVAQTERGEKSMVMNQYIDLKEIKIEKNSDLFQIDTLDNEPILILKDNMYNQDIDSFTGKIIDDVRGKVLLFGEEKRDYTMTVDMKFLGAHIDLEGAGWFGIVIRAQDCDNYEVVWFMPGGTEGSNTVAYVPVAHGIVPWWTEAYAQQEKGDIFIPQNDWFTVRADVIGEQFSVYVNDQFTVEKKLTYYLQYGRPGLFVGTATDAAFRRIQMRDRDVPDGD